jgi:hypothetical protein
MIVVKLETHKGMELVNPSWKLIKTVDFSERETFQASILWMQDRHLIVEELPEQPYVNGTWDDETVKNAIENYIKENYANKE